MVMPATPVANFVMRQPGLALAALDRFLHPVSGQGDTGKLFFRSLVGSVGKIKIALGRADFIQRANDHQGFVVSHIVLRDLGLHRASDDFDFQGSLFGIFVHALVGSESRHWSTR